MPFIWSKDRLSLSKWISSVEKTLWRHSPFRNQDPAKDGLTLWRERILFSVLAAGNGLAILALIPSVFMAFSEGLWLLAVVDICAVLGSACLLMIGRIDLRMKTAGALLITFLIGIAVITQAGFLSGGPAWLFCFAVLSGVLLGLRAALIAILLNATALFVLWWLSSLGMVSSPSESFGTSRALTAWVNFLFLNSVSAVSVAVLVNGLQSLNQKAIAATNALKEEREDLLQTREKLEKEIVVRVNSETALHQSEQKYRLLAENIQDVIWMMDMNFAFTYVSPSIERLQGWSPNEYLTLPLNEIMAPASLNKVIGEFNLQVDLGQKSGSYARTCTLELELLRKSNSSVWAEVTASFLLGESGYPIGMLGVTRDITERRRADKEKAGSSGESGALQKNGSSWNSRRRGRP